MEALGLNLGYLFVQIFNFLIVFLILRAFVFIPIMRLLEKRRSSIAQGLEDARMAADARANAEKEARDIISKSQADSALKVREAIERAEVAYQEIIAKAELDAVKIRSDAAADANQERDRLLLDMRGKVASLAVAATGKLVGEELKDSQRQRSLIEEFFSGIKSGKVTVLESAHLTGATAEIISAVPLTENEQETIRQDVIAMAGSQTVTFRVDPTILGGLVVKVGDKVVDGSVSGQLESLRQNLR